MSFSLDLTKPLGRLGLAINTVILGAVFYGVSAGAYHYMSHTLPESEAHHQEAVVKAALVDKVVAKAKTAAKGKTFDAAAAKAQADALKYSEFNARYALLESKRRAKSITEEEYKATLSELRKELAL